MTEQTLGQAAQSYEKPEPKTIADLDSFPVNIPIHSEIVKEGEPDQWTKNFVKVEGVEYRVPATVLEGIQDILKENPEAKVFKVTKKGEGRKSKYSVIQKG